MSAAALPQALPQEPACGACNGETYFNGYVYTCEDCQLCFNPDDDLEASFLDKDASPCGVGCDNYWHGDNEIKQGMGFDCGTCRLPADHNSMHWTGCEAKRITP